MTPASFNECVSAISNVFDCDIEEATRKAFGLGPVVCTYAVLFDQAYTAHMASLGNDDTWQAYCKAKNNWTEAYYADANPLNVKG